LGVDYVRDVADETAAAMKPVHLWMIGDIPPSELQAFLQHVRDFDVAHPGCHFAISVDAEEMATEEMIKALQLTPPFPFLRMKKR